MMGFIVTHMKIGVRSYFAPLILLSRGAKFVGREYQKIVDER